MKLSVTLPKKLWSTPTLKATIKIDDPGTPIEISASAVETAAEAIKEALGVDIDLRVVRQEDTQ
jgi:hypothetical protein